MAKMAQPYLFPPKFCPWSSANHTYGHYVGEMQRQFGSKDGQDILFGIYVMLPPKVRFVIDDLVLVDMRPPGIPTYSVRVKRDGHLGNFYARLCKQLWKAGGCTSRHDWDAYLGRRASFLFTLLPTAIFFAATQAVACRNSWVTPLGVHSGHFRYLLFYTANDTLAGYGPNSPRWVKDLWPAVLFNLAIWKRDDLAWFLSHFLDDGGDYKARWKSLKKQPRLCVHCLEEITGNCIECATCHGPCHSDQVESGSICRLAHRCPDMGPVWKHR